MEGAAGGPLSREQKKRVCMLARTAWDRLGTPGWNAAEQAGVPAELRLSQREAFDLWRHNEQAQASGAAHLTCAENRLFPLLMAHFAELAGKPREEKYWAQRAAGDPQRQALFALRRALHQAKGAIEQPEAYCLAIAHSKFKTHDLESLSPRQLWVLVFDMRRAAQKRRGHVAGVPF